MIKRKLDFILDFLKTTSQIKSFIFLDCDYKIFTDAFILKSRFYIHLHKTSLRILINVHCYE